MPLDVPRPGSGPAVVLVVNCGPCEAYIERCLTSIQSQTFTRWRALVTVDPHGDDTLVRAEAFAAGEPRVSVKGNPLRRWSMDNLRRAIARSGADDEDVIVCLDGDDWFLHERALAIVAGAYAREDCWLTYGSWLSNSPPHPGRWPAYPADTRDFRAAPWLATAVRTWKKWLWDRIDPADFLDERGRYFRVTEDQAVMLPMLEMAGTARAFHIAEPLMLYNRANPHACGETMYADMKRNEAFIRDQKPYPRLMAKPQKGAPSRHEEPGARGT